MSILVNLCISFSMLLIPFFTRSLLNDGLGSTSTAVMAVATAPIVRGVTATPKIAYRGAKASLQYLNKKRRKHFAKPSKSVR